MSGSNFPYIALWTSQVEQPSTENADRSLDFFLQLSQSHHSPYSEYGNPFGYPRSILPHSHSSAGVSMLHYRINSDPITRQTLPTDNNQERYRHLHEYTPQTLNSSALSGVSRPASSWSATSNAFGTCGPTGLLDPRASETWTSVTAASDYATPVASPSSSDQWLNPLTPQEGTSPCSVPLSPLPTNVVLPLIGSASDSQVTDFINKSFPEGTPDYKARRTALEQVLYSDWKRNNEKEPNNGLLTQFVVMKDAKWECLFYVGNKRCPCSSTRNVQALEHIRRHIKLEPYVCQGLPW